MSGGYWIDFTPKPPKPPEVLEPGSYDCKVVGIRMRDSLVLHRRYVQWELKVLNIDFDFTLWYATLLEDRNKELQQMIAALTGKTPTGRFLFRMKDYLRKTLVADVVVKEMHFIDGVKKLNQVTRVGHP
jgi:hypothetical protein